MTTAKFKTGNIYATPGVNRHIPSVEVLDALGRHSRGDWGTVGEEDRQENELSLVEGYLLLTSRPWRRFFLAVI